MHAVGRRALLPALALALTAPQYRELLKQAMPLIVGRREDGRWLILEERSESQP